MSPEAQVKEAKLKDNLWTAFKEMDRDGVNQLLVMQDHEIAGILSRESILSFIRDLQELDI
jgi:predicted transcriptional regulator